MTTARWDRAAADPPRSHGAAPASRPPGGDPHTLVCVQATVRSYDEVTRSGSVFLDDGSVLEFGAPAFDAGPLRLLRTGQRVNLVVSGGEITFITLSTFPVPEA